MKLAACLKPVSHKPHLFGTLVQPQVDVNDSNTKRDCTFEKGVPPKALLPPCHSLPGHAASLLLPSHPLSQPAENAGDRTESNRELSRGKAWSPSPSHMTEVYTAKAPVIHSIPPITLDLDSRRTRP